MINSTEYHPQFFTATILAWKHLLKEDVYKEIISALQNLVRMEKVIILDLL
jgi:putative transposase